MPDVQKITDSERLMKKIYKLNLVEFGEPRIRLVYNKGKEKGLMDHCKRVLKEKFPKESSILITRAGNKLAKELYEKYIKPTAVSKSQRL